MKPRNPQSKKEFNQSRPFIQEHHRVSQGIKTYQARIKALAFDSEPSPDLELILRIKRPEMNTLSLLSIIKTRGSQSEKNDTWHRVLGYFALKMDHAHGIGNFEQEKFLQGLLQELARFVQKEVVDASP